MSTDQTLVPPGSLVQEHAVVDLDLVVPSRHIKLSRRSKSSFLHLFSSETYLPHGSKIENIE